MNPTHLSIPVYECGVQAGFPSPAESYVDKSLDLNEFLVSNPASTFFVYVTGDSMDLAGMVEGDSCRRPLAGAPERRHCHHEH